MNKIQAKLLNIVGTCISENPSEPCIVECLIRWKDGDIVKDLVSVGNLGWLDKDQYETIDAATTFAFDDIAAMAQCVTQLDFDESDYSDDEEWYRQEVEKYADGVEDTEFYFGTKEDFCIIDIYAAYPASEY